MWFRKKLLKKKINLILFMVAILAAFVAMIIVFGEEKKGMMKYGSIPILVAVYAVIVYKIKLIPKLIDRDFDATIEAFVPRIELKIVGRMPIRIPVYDVHVKDDKGKAHVFTYKQSTTNPFYYTPGARVRHYAGAKFLVKHNPGELEYICPICGRNTRNQNLTYCAFCRVNFEDLRKNN